MADAIGSLQTVIRELAHPLPLDKIAAVVADAGTRTLDAVVLMAIYDDAARHVRFLTPASFESVAEALVGVGPSANGGSTTSHALAARIRADGRPLGIIVAVRMHDPPFSEKDRAFLNVLAGVSALALERLRLSSDASYSRHEPLDGSHVKLGDMDIDLEDQEVVLGDRRARLTPSELRLLLFLAADPGRPRTRGEILRHLWHTDHVGDERACDAHISNLRRKIERDPSRPERVVTLRGVGYALRVRRSSTGRT